MKDHVAPAVAFANRGYHVLVEKPMAVTEQDCRWDTEILSLATSGFGKIWISDWMLCVYAKIIDNHKEYINVMTRKITRACEEAGVMLVVCHVLRSHPLVVYSFHNFTFLAIKSKNLIF